MSTNRKPYRILFICMGNICRSPAAEMVFRKQTSDAGRSADFEIDSAGTIGFHTGKGPDPRMAETLRRRGYPIMGSSRQVRRSDLDDFDLLLVADQENLEDVRRLASSDAQKKKIRLLTDYCQDEEADYVPDPYYGGGAGFEKVADLVEDACQGLLNELK